MQLFGIKRVGFSGVFSVLTSMPLLAMAAEIRCPLQMQSAFENVSANVEGWEARRIYTKHLLEAFEVRESNQHDPRKSQTSIYDDSKTFTAESGDVVNVLTWNLDGLPNPVAVCGYTFTSVGLTRSIAGFKKCEVRSVSKRGVGPEKIVSARCF